MSSKRAAAQGWVAEHAATLAKWSLIGVPIAVALQVFSTVQQLSHLFAPAAGERPMVLGVFVATSLVSLAFVALGMLTIGNRSVRGRAALGTMLGGAFLLLFLVVSALMWNSLTVL